MKKVSSRTSRTSPSSRARGVKLSRKSSPAKKVSGKKRAAIKTKRPAHTARTAASTQVSSAQDGFNPNANGTIRAMVSQPDGKMIIGGDFTTVGGIARNRIARVNPDGTLDATFNPNANSSVHAIALQPDGKILVGGEFTTIGGNRRACTARLDGETGLPDSFNPAPDSYVYAIALQTDGQIMLGGEFFSVGGGPNNYIYHFLARVSAAGVLDRSFQHSYMDDYVRCIVVQPYGKILAGVDFLDRNYLNRF